MHIAMIGTGYVGLVSGTCFADFGHQVTCVDTDAQKIKALNDGLIPIYEPGLEAMVKKNQAAGRLTFTTDLAKAITSAETVFIAVGTPTRRGSGHADLRYVYAVTDDIAKHILPDRFIVIVTKSTVPVGTGDLVYQKLAQSCSEHNFAVVSNPEFLREGAAIDDFKRPDRIIIGTDNEQARTVMRAIYRPLFLNEPPLLFTSRRSSELIKYASNAFLATKITFINEMATLCEAVGANVQDVAKGIGMDKRIGSKFLHAGPGYGGSCFPKDTQALIRTAQENQIELSIIKTVVTANEAHKHRIVNKIVAACGHSIKNKKLAILGLAFKPNTDDMREAASLTLIPALQKQGAHISAYDPQSMPEAKPLLSDIEYAADPYICTEQADAVIILTEWDEFRALDMARLKSTLRGSIMIDLRNIYNPDEMRTFGFEYSSVGRD